MVNSHPQQRLETRCLCRDTISNHRHWTTSPGSMPGRGGSMLVFWKCVGLTYVPGCSLQSGACARQAATRDAVPAPQGGSEKCFFTNPYRHGKRLSLQQGEAGQCPDFLEMRRTSVYVKRSSQSCELALRAAMTDAGPGHQSTADQCLFWNVQISASPTDV